MAHDRHIEAGKVENLGTGWVGQQLAEIRRLIFTFGKLNQMRIAIAIGQLHNAQPIAHIVQAHSLGIDGNIPFQFQGIG